MASRFPNRRGTFPLEPAIALVLRRSSANRIWSSWRAWRFVGTSPERLRQGKQLSKVSETCGVPLPDLEWATPVRVGSGLRVFGHHFLPDSVRQQHRRWCPNCLIEEPYHRSSWDIAALSHCLRHQLRLQTICTACNQPTEWFLGDFSRCQCGKRLTGSNVAEAQESELAFDKWLHSKLMEHSPSGRHLDDPVSCPILDELPLQDAISVVERFGAFSINPVDTFAETWSSAGPTAVLLKGYEVALAGESGVDSLLDKLFDARNERNERLRNAGGKLRRWGVQAAYGSSFALWFSGRVKAGAYSSIAPIVVRHAKSRVLLKSGSTVFGKTSSETALTLSAAAKLCGVGRGRLNEFLRLTGVILPGKHQGMPLRLPFALAQEYAERFADCLKLSDTADLLGIGEAPLADLVKAKRLPAMIEGGGKLQDYAIERREVERLLNRLESLSAGDSTPTLLPITKAFAGKAGVSTLVGWALDGLLPIRAIDENAIGLQRLMVKRSDVLQLNRVERNDEITIQKAAERLGIKWEAVKQLLNLEYLKLDGKFVTSNSIESFERHYVKGSDVAASLNMHWKWAPRKLAQIGIEPVIDRTQCRSVFYARAQVENLPSRFTA